MSGFKFDEEKHLYSYNGIDVPGITYLLEKYDLTGYSDIPPHILEPARILGSVVHKTTELFDNGTLKWSTVDPIVMPYIEAWINFRTTTSFKPVSIEPRLYSAKYGFAGTPDRAGELNGKMSAVEIKTTKDYHRAMGVQTSAQKILLDENFGLNIKKRYVIVLKENGTWYPENCKDYRDESVFLSCLAIEKWKRNGR